MTAIEKKTAQIPQVEQLIKYMNNGMISLIDASGKVKDLYLKGYIAYDHANAAIRILARIKVKE